MKKIKKDIKTVYYIGNEILNTQRQLEIAKSRDDYDTCIKLRVNKYIFIVEKARRYNKEERWI